MCHVLIIEDEPMIAMSIEAALKDVGADSFDFATTEDDAVAAARRHRPDVITSDVALLTGTGPHAVRAIHAEMGGIPVIFVTATPRDCVPCDPPGSILTKPFSEPRLHEAFRKALEAA